MTKLSKYLYRAASTVGGVAAVLLIPGAMTLWIAWKIAKWAESKEVKYRGY